MSLVIEYAPRAEAIDWLGLIKSEYREIPGLTLTLPQARRLWQLDDQTSAVLLTTLVDTKFLRRTTSGSYVRADAG